MFKIILEELKYLKNKSWGLLALIMVLFVPSVYGGVFLTAFNRPIHNMDRAKIVVLDEGNNADTLKSLAKKHKIDIGSTQFNMNIVKAPDVYKNRSEIKAAIKGNKYQAAIFIGKDFEKKLKDMQANLFTKPIYQIEIPKLDFFTSYKNNYLQSELIEMRAGIFSLQKNIILSFIKDKNSKDKIEDILNSKMNLINFISEGSEKIDDYSQGMFPYFFAIALWAGCVVMVFLFKNHRAGPISKKASTFKNYFSRSILWILTGWMQAIILLSLCFIVGVKIDTNPFYLIVSSLIISTIFSLFVQSIAFIFRFGELGSFIVLILLITQLVAASGTFPVEMQIKFFQYINPVIPFTYVIKILREFLYQPDAKTIIILQCKLSLFLISVPFSLFVNYISDKIKLRRYGKYSSHEIYFYDE